MLWHPKPLSGITCLDCKSWLPRPQKQHTSYATVILSTACQLLTLFTKRLPTACRVVGSATSAGSVPGFTGCAELTGWALGSSAISPIAVAKACTSALLSACGTLPAGAATWPLCVAHKVTLAAWLPSCGS